RVGLPGKRRDLEVEEQDLRPRGEAPHVVVARRDEDVRRRVAVLPRDRHQRAVEADIERRRIRRDDDAAEVGRRRRLRARRRSRRRRGGGRGGRGRGRGRGGGGGSGRPLVLLGRGA